MRVLMKLVLTVTLVMVMLAIALPASANVRGDGPPPFYAALLPGDEWTAIVFYRPTSCVPQDFNLLNRADVPRVFSCGPTTVDGFTLWKNGPGIDPVPIHVNLHGKGRVPIWLIRTSEWEAAVADGNLTIGELEALPSLVKGTASRYHETAHPIGVANNPKLTITARGTLEDGRTFHFHLAEVTGTLWRVRVTFKR